MVQLWTRRIYLQLLSTYNSTSNLFDIAPSWELRYDTSLTSTENLSMQAYVSLV